MVHRPRLVPMRTLDDIRARLRAMLPELRCRYPIASLGVFGSWARGEQAQWSDLDLLVEFDGRVDFFAFLELEEEIGKRLGLRVELVTRRALKPLVRESVLSDLVPV
jgi:hypothetical protein